MLAAIFQPSIRLPSHAFAASAALILAGAALILIPVLLNGFPFVFDDSVDYLVFTPRLYRSPFYGLFVFGFHLNRFIWGPVIAQAIIISHLIWLIQRSILGHVSSMIFLFIVSLLVAFSSLPYVAGFLMADFFTPVMILTMYLLIFCLNKMSRLETSYIFLLSCIAIAAHVSHITMAVAVFIPLLLLSFLQDRKGILKTITVAGSPIALAACAVLLNNAVIHKTASLTAAGPVFVLANLIEYGPAREYLQEACPIANYRICPAVNGLPQNANQFLWGGTLEKLGGFSGMRDEAHTIVTRTIRSRPIEVVSLAAKLVIRGLMSHEPGLELAPVGNEPWLRDVIHKKFSLNEAAYLSSAQHQNALPHRLLRSIDMVAFPLSVVLLFGALIVCIRNGRFLSATLAALIFYAYAINAALCAVASGVYDRYQARLSWLFVMSAAILVAESILVYKRERSSLATGSELRGLEAGA